MGFDEGSSAKLAVSGFGDSVRPESNAEVRKKIKQQLMDDVEVETQAKVCSVQYDVCLY
ncbi:hypothetical protein KIN20_026519 [Parelaphostrongylus tenuis]|uniref:Uncharacterized protein n=1 Tax=Parelaphostrongylus tenuis TaxID=148309 RepID=A0AAD5QY61_PARTN|nr:hypothetical protein KIN20_026519 [Parelaphostrongylus tenuis]